MATELDPLRRLAEITARFEHHRNSDTFVDQALEMLKQSLEAESVVLRPAGEGLDPGVREKASRGGIAHGEDGRLYLSLKIGRTSHGYIMIIPRADRPVSAVVERVLVATAANLAAALETAALLDKVRNASAPTATSAGAPARITGRPAAGGMGEGEILHWEQGPDLSQEETDLSLEVKDFDAALAAAHDQLTELQAGAATEIDDVAAGIFEAHLLMLLDENFSGAMRDLIVRGMQPVRAVQRVVSDFVTIFSTSEDPLFVEKAEDVRDLGYRLVANLRGEVWSGEDGRGRIVIADRVFPSELVSLAARHAGGLILTAGAATAHIAILARSLGLPLMVAEKDQLRLVPNGTPAVLDATMGILYLEPGASAGAGGKGGAGHGGGAGAGQMREDVEASRQAVAGVDPSYLLSANVNLYRDARKAAELGMKGIGLYRSEFPFIIRNELLSEEEQYRIYRRIATALPGGKVTLRTADIGGDKIMSARGETEQNPFLGVRGIRFSLANRDAFRDQLRAMLRAGRDRELRILFPMVSSVEEFDEAADYARECMAEMDGDGVEHNRTPEFGAMIELPSAVEAVDDLAGHADFLSIGTNDLVMYLLAVDRTNARLSDLYRSYHPVVLRVLHRIVVAAGEDAGRLSLCGDAAADPALLEFFVGIGLRGFSVAPDRAGDTATALSHLDPQVARREAETMLSIRRVADMEAYLQARARDRVRANG